LVDSEDRKIEFIEDQLEEIPNSAEWKIVDF